MSNIVPTTIGAIVPSNTNYSTVAIEPRKQGLWDWYQSIKAPVVQNAPTPVQSAVNGIRHYAEGAGVALLLALVESDLGGLDIKDKYPADGIGAAIMFAMSIKDSGSPDGISNDFRAIGQSCSDVFFYRKMLEWRAKSKTKEVSTTLSQFSGEGDQIVACAKAMGF